MQILSTDATAFVADPNVLRVVTASIAEISGVQEDDVTVTFNIETRRLRGNVGRNLQTANILASYIITAPQDTDVASIANAINATTPDTLTATLSEALDEALGRGTFIVIVVSRSDPATTTEATTTAAGTTTTDTSTKFVLSQVQGNLILSASYSAIFAGGAPLPGIKAALVAAIAEIAGVDVSVVVVTLTSPHRLRLDTVELSIAYAIMVSAKEGAAVVERITSTDLDSATVVVAQHLSNAGIDDTVRVVSLSATFTGGDAGTIVKDLLAVWIFVGIGGGVGVLLAVLCCCFVRYCCHCGKPAKQTKAPQTLTSMEEGKGGKHAVYAI